MIFSICPEDFSDKLFQDETEAKKYDKDNETAYFLNSIGLFLIPDLLSARTSIQKINAYSKHIPTIYDFSGGVKSKDCIAELGNAFLYEYSTLNGVEEAVEPFFKVLSCFMVITEMYNNYRFWQQERYEDSQRAKENLSKLSNVSWDNNLKTFVESQSN